MVLPNKPVDVEKLEANKVYAQIASVTPYFDASETDRESPFQRNFNTGMFVFLCTPARLHSSLFAREEGLSRSMGDEALCLPH